MAVSSTTNKVSYNGDGSTATFSYTFKIFANADLQVTIRDANGTETTQTLDTEYIVTGAGSASGGNVTFKYNTGNSSDPEYSTTDYRPASGETITIKRVVTLTQGTDYVENDPFPAQSHEDALDRLTFIQQQQQEEIDRSIKASVTNTLTGSEFTVSAADRANKIFAFDSSGNLSIAQELGTFRGNWSASVAYNQRDIVKDTNNNNIYIANTAHTSSGAVPLSSNTDSAKWDLIVDAASATTSATNAANSATAAATSASNAATSESNAATSETNAATSETNAATSATAAQTAQAAAEAALDTFDDRFLGAKSSDPSQDNDGNALVDGALYFDTTNDLMKVYDLTNTVWRQLALTGSNQTNVNTVAGISSNVTTVAGISSDVTTVASDTTDIGTVATDIANVNSVAGSITNVNTVATNISDVNNFADTYFISATAPSSPTTGDLWFDTTNNAMKVYGSSGFQNAGSSVNGTSERNTYTATSGQTSFAATYDAGYVDVYLNGIKLIDGTHFTATNGTSVVLSSGAALDDTVDIVAYGTFELSNFSINDANDVNTTGATNGQVLAYNSTSTDFEPTTITSDLVGDTTPQLGGNLDGNGNTIDLSGSTEAFIMPKGTTAQRPSSATTGMVRYNTTESLYETYDGTRWRHISTSDYTVDLSYLSVAGGGGGGQGWNAGGGGGGAGGFLTGTSTVIVGTSLSVVVGAGGAGFSNGSNSSISNISVTSIGGGAGSPYSQAAGTNGNSGGSGGGGGSGQYTGNVGYGGSGTAGQGNGGGASNNNQANQWAGGGGGGANGGGGSASGGGAYGGDGGAGKSSSISGTSVTYAGGGGGYSPANPGSGGSGGGASSGSNAAANLGGGAGAGNHSGGSGIVIIAYAGSQKGTGGTITTAGGNTIHTFTSSGTFELTG